MNGMVPPTCNSYARANNDNHSAHVNIRTATISDAPRIALIHVETWRTAYRGQIPDSILDSLNVQRRTLFWQERIAQMQSPVMVAEKDGEVIGFCDLVPSRDDDANHQTVAEIAAIYVHPHYWRNGAGRALCQSALTGARQRAYQNVTLWVLASNTPAKVFYETLGFRPDGTTKTERTADGTELHEIRFRITV